MRVAAPPTSVAGNNILSESQQIAQVQAQIAQFESLAQTMEKNIKKLKVCMLNFLEFTLLLCKDHLVQIASESTELCTQSLHL